MWVTGLYVRSDGVRQSSALTLRDDTLAWVMPPARTTTFACCEGEPELLIALQLDAPGRQSILSIAAVDYRVDPWSYHAVLMLNDTAALTTP